MGSDTVITDAESARIDQISGLTDADLDAQLRALSAHPGPGTARDERECLLFMHECEARFADLDEAARDDYLRRVGIDPEEARKNAQFIFEVFRSEKSPYEAAAAIRRDIEIRMALRDGTPLTSH